MEEIVSTLQGNGCTPDARRSSAALPDATYGRVTSPIGAELLAGFATRSLRAPTTAFRRYSVQPMHLADDPGATAANLLAAIELVRSHPTWYLGVQLHKMLGLPQRSPDP